MAIDFSQMFGQQPDLTGIVSPDQQEAMKSGALNQGLLSGLFTLLQASGAQPRPIGLGQALGAAGATGIGAYGESFDKSLKNILTNFQLKDIVRKQQEAEQLKQLYGSSVIPQYTEKDGKKELSGINVDMKTLIPALQGMGRFDLISQIGESQKLLRQSGLMGGGAEAPSPFAPYVMSESPAVKQLATQLEAGFRKGIISEEDAFKRIEPLARMEEQFTQRRIAAGEKAAAGTKFTEEENKAAGFSDRMNLASQQMSALEGKIAAKQLEGKSAEEPYATTLTQTAGGVPLVGDYLRGKVSSSEQKQYRQAQENWVRANLRKESGAVIGPGEMSDEIANYFPMPTDDAATIQQKRVARAVTQDAMRKAAGRAYQPFDLESFKKSKGLE